MQSIKDPQGEKHTLSVNKKQPQRMSRGVLGAQSKMVHPTKTKSFVILKMW
jgi:hypothetical protein